MRTFEHFNNPAEDVCPICQTNADYPIVLMPIPGTEDDGNVQAQQVHERCINYWVTWIEEQIHTDDIPEVTEVSGARRGHFAGGEPIFVFGSNLAGRHGKGAALEAKRHWGAVYGQEEGLQGRSYAIPTKDSRLKPLPLAIIREYVNGFIHFAQLHPELNFQLTAIGCGYAGYSPVDIAPLFINAPENVYLPPVFKEMLKEIL